MKTYLMYWKRYVTYVKYIEICKIHLKRERKEN